MSGSDFGGIFWLFFSIMMRLYRIMLSLEESTQPNFFGPEIGLKGVCGLPSSTAQGSQSIFRPSNLPSPPNPQAQMEGMWEKNTTPL